MDNRFYKDCAFHDTYSGMPQHYHDEYEMLYIASGRASLTIMGKLYEVGAGSAVFISRYEDHIVVGHGDFSCYNVLIFAETIDEIIGDKTLCSIFKNRGGSFSHVYDMSNQSELFEGLFKKMVDEFRKGRLYATNMISLYLHEMLIETMRRYPSAFQSVFSPIDEEIAMIQEMIDVNCTNEIRIAEIAEKYYVSQQHLCRVFKKRTGYSPKQYLTNMRISKAKSMLVNTNMRIHDVAYMSGFGDESNFIRRFTKYAGISPSKYRESQRQIMSLEGGEAADQNPGYP